MADSSANGSAAMSHHHKQRTLDKWIEPSLPEPVPSYKDLPNLNLPPYGVLTNMAPLGTLPNPKMQKMAKTEAIAKVKPKNGGASASSVSTPMEETMTPDPMPHPDTRRSQSHKEEDIDYHPPVTPTAPKPAPAPQVIANGTRPSFSNPPRTASQNSFTPLSTGQTLSAPRPASSSLFSSTNMSRPPIRIEQVVLSAIRMARGAGRHHTAFALTDLVTHHRDDPNVERVLKAVAHSEGNIHPSLMAEFSTMVQQKKRESRRKGLPFPERRASSTFAAPDIRFTTPSYNSPSKKTATVSDSLPEEPRSDSRPSPKRPSKSPNKDYEHAHVNKKLKSNSFGEEKQAVTADPPSDMNDSSMPQSLSDASRSSSPLSDLDDMEELLEAGNFAPTETTSEERTSITETHARVRPASTRKSAVGGPKLHTFLPNTTNMAVAASLSPSLSSFPSNNNSTKSHKKNPSGPQRLDPNDAREVLRRKARDVTNGEPISESDVRTPMTSLEIESESEGTEEPVATFRSAPSGLRLRLRNVPKGPVNDESDKSSPTFLPFQHEMAPPSSTNSRQSTPNPYGRPTRKAKTGPRVKSSPMKNRAVPLAGISRASGERNSPVGNGGFGSAMDDNHDDYCSSCGGGGMIVCCDGEGCKRSYHWLCLDPPRREEDVDSTESVYCCSCTAAMRTATKRVPGLFASLLDNIERKNPVAFRLSKDITEYFEGVKAGPQGEYEDILPASHKTKNRAGYEEAPDYLRLRDNRGNTIMCHQCQRSAASGQPIIPCSFCSLHWHLDCLDPPLANPPSRDRPWKCPCHVDDLLDKIPGMLGPAHKYRKIKSAAALRPAVPRHVRNNGHIEIENSPSDDEADSSGFYNQNVFGKEYRLPEHGIKLDFLTKVKRDNMRGTRKRKREEPPSPAKKRLNTRTIHDQQAALNLTALASKAVDFQSHDQLPNLINVLISQAPDDVVKLMAQADATNLERGHIEGQDKISLLALGNALTALLKQVEALQGAKSDGKETPEEDGKVASTTVPPIVQGRDGEMGTSATDGQDDRDMLL